MERGSTAMAPSSFSHTVIEHLLSLALCYPAPPGCHTQSHSSRKCLNSRGSSQKRGVIIKCISNAGTLPQTCRVNCSVVDVNSLELLEAFWYSNKAAAFILNSYTILPTPLSFFEQNAASTTSALKMASLSSTPLCGHPLQTGCYACFQKQF